MLIKTTAELKSYFSGIDKDYNFPSLQSFVLDAEQDILIPWIGQEIYDTASTAYNADDPPAGKLAELIIYLQKAVTHLAFMLSADSGSFRVADSGFYVVMTATNKPVSDKKMSEFKKGRRESGYRAMEQAIDFLEANTLEEAFSGYIASEAHTFHRSFFINSSVLFTRYFKKVNNSAYLFWQLLDALDFAERTYLVPTLGQPYYDTLKEAVLANYFDDEQKKLFPYIYRALVNFTIAKAVPGLPIDFEGTNLVISSQPTKGNFDVVEDKTPASSLQLGNLVTDAFATGMSELRNLQSYLVANAAVLTGYVLPEFTDDVDINDDPCSPTYFV